MSLKAKELAKWQQARVPAAELYVGSAAYKGLGEGGVPSTDAEGAELSEKKKKEIKKEMDKQVPFVASSRACARLNTILIPSEPLSAR